MIATCIVCGIELFDDERGGMCMQCRADADDDPPESSGEIWVPDLLDEEPLW